MDNKMVKYFPCGEANFPSRIPPHKKPFPEWFNLSGEKRSPNKGEWYISGAIPAAYLATKDLTMEHTIAAPIAAPPKEIIQDGFIYKLYKAV